MTDSPAVTWAPVTDDVLLIVLSHPPANALGPAIVEGLHDALDAAGDLKVIVVASAFPDLFAAGADIKHMSSIDADGFTAYGDSLRSALERLTARVSVAAVEGRALGGGLELAMACTMRVAGESAGFGLPEVKLGLIPGAGGTQRLPRLVGRGRALDLMLTGRQVDAAEAHAMGLVDRLVPAGAATTAALRLAEELSVLSLPAQQAVIRTVGAAFDLPLAEGLRYEAGQVRELFEHGEAKEGITAFLQKRGPDFSARWRP